MSSRNRRSRKSFEEYYVSPDNDVDMRSNASYSGDDDNEMDERLSDHDNYTKTIIKKGEKSLRFKGDKDKDIQNDSFGSSHIKHDSSDLSAIHKSSGSDEKSDEDNCDTQANRERNSSLKKPRIFQNFDEENLSQSDTEEYLPREGQVFENSLKVPRKREGSKRRPRNIAENENHKTPFHTQSSSNNESIRGVNDVSHSGQGIVLRRRVNRQAVVQSKEASLTGRISTDLRSHHGFKSLSTQMSDASEMSSSVAAGVATLEHLNEKNKKEFFEAFAEKEPTQNDLIKNENADIISPQNLKVIGELDLAKVPDHLCKDLAKDEKTFAPFLDLLQVPTSVAELNRLWAKGTSNAPVRFSNLDTFEVLSPNCGSTKSEVNDGEVRKGSEKDSIKCMDNSLKSMVQDENSVAMMLDSMSLSFGRRDENLLKDVENENRPTISVDYCHPLSSIDDAAPNLEITSTTSSSDGVTNPQSEVCSPRKITKLKVVEKSLNESVAVPKITRKNKNTDSIQSNIITKPLQEQLKNEEQIVPELTKSPFDNKREENKAEKEMENVKFVAKSPSQHSQIQKEVGHEKVSHLETNPIAKKPWQLSAQKKANGTRKLDPSDMGEKVHFQKVKSLSAAPPSSKQSKQPSSPRKKAQDEKKILDEAVDSSPQHSHVPKEKIEQEKPSHLEVQPMAKKPWQHSNRQKAIDTSKVNSFGVAEKTPFQQVKSPPAAPPLPKQTKQSLPLSPRKRGRVSTSQEAGDKNGASIRHRKYNANPSQQTLTSSRKTKTLAKSEDVVRPTESVQDFMPSKDKSVPSKTEKTITPSKQAQIDESSLLRSSIPRPSGKNAADSNLRGEVSPDIFEFRALTKSSTPTLTREEIHALSRLYDPSDPSVGKDVHLSSKSHVLSNNLVPPGSSSEGQDESVKRIMYVPILNPAYIASSKMKRTEQR